MPATLLLTDALADALAYSVSRGVPIETASAAAGISRGQFYEWLQSAERGTWQDGSPVSDQTRPKLLAFLEKIRRAEAEWEANQVLAIMEDAERFNEKTGLRDWRARHALLTSHPRTRKRWGQHIEIEQSGQVLHEHTLARQLEDNELTQALEAFDALPPAQDA